MSQKIDPISIFLNDSEGSQMLEAMILEKYHLYEALMAKREEVLTDDDLYPAFEGEIRPYFLEKLWELKFGYQAKEIAKELRNMTYWYQKATGGTQGRTEWEKKYEHATDYVRIEGVVLGLLRVKSLKRNIKCPFHDEKTPSFKVYPGSNRFVCFGCGVSGSPIDFVMRYRNCDFKEAVEFLQNF